MHLCHNTRNHHIHHNFHSHRIHHNHPHMLRWYTLHPCQDCSTDRRIEQIRCILLEG